MRFPCMQALPTNHIEIAHIVEACTWQPRLELGMHRDQGSCSACCKGDSGMLYTLTSFRASGVVVFICYRYPQGLNKPSASTYLDGYAE